MGSTASSLLFAGSVLGIVGGLWLLVRGLSAYREAGRIGDIGTSAIASLAAGEVRVSGVIEAAELTLISPLQSRSCVYYRSRMREAQGRDRRTILDEERAVGFRVHDPTGEVRVFPRGATWDVPDRFGASDDALGDPPSGLALRSGPATVTGAPDRDEQVARLLTPRPAADRSSALDDAFVLDGGLALGGVDALGLSMLGARDYREARLEPGDTVTIVGSALPYDQLPEGEDAGDASHATGGPLAAADDPEIAADLADGRAAGILETDPEEAWGNAAIPGFGIGRPVRPPELDPAARALPLAEAGAAERSRRLFEIAPDTLVLAATPGRPLLISSGEPGVAVTRHEDRFLAGLAGAILAIVSAVVLALQLGGVS
jgi:hypothetical protein